MDAPGFYEFSEAILTPFGRVVILVFSVSTRSGKEAGSSMPLSGKSKGGRLDELPPVNQLKIPPDDDFAATALELANLVRFPLPPRLYYRKVSKV
ncbi:hypothetical protein HanXRQr2_Chr06g0249121 [Helianthus annuus]|uniref:Uncharacterized protein n=1 Tax=Helianthus annuus TaxID=4232 RepID=A0A9K3IRH5_HELAN|nr:hypothetical protein HanXRQr2_Chr06g0249121 [Helianthus annuus]